MVCEPVAVRVIACFLCFCGSASLHEWLLHFLVKCFFTVSRMKKPSDTKYVAKCAADHLIPMLEAV